VYVGFGFCIFRTTSSKLHSPWVLSPVHPPGIAEREILHDFGEGLICHLNDEVHVVCHQAEGMDLMTEALGPFLEQKIEPVPVGIVGKVK